ncbi:MAG: hypothetical protein HUK24_09270, partial [Sphaerochaetaceae bacterium]|nr:hypothetical protein [Sphaerochaetaceae bacterium]
NITVNNIIPEKNAPKENYLETVNLFSDFDALEKESKEKEKQEDKEKKVEKAVVDLKKRFGKNVMLKAMNLEEGATAKQRNSQIGGHKA